MKNNAYVNYVFKKGFILNEANLKKINEIIKKRLGELGLEKELGFEIFRADSYCIICDSIENVIAEDNWKSTKIIRIKMEAKKEGEFNIVLDFDEQSKVALLIEGSNRDKVFLLYSDLKDFIEKEVTTANKISSDKFYKILPLITVIFLLVSILIISLIRKKIPVEIIESNDITQKLNYLIIQTQIKDSLADSANKCILTIIISLYLVPTMFVAGYNYFNPYNVFVLGKEINNFEKKIELKKQIFWGIIVALVIGIIGGVIVYFLTKGR